MVAERIWVEVWSPIVHLAGKWTFHVIAVGSVAAVVVVGYTQHPCTNQHRHRHMRNRMEFEDETENGISK